MPGGCPLPNYSSVIRWTVQDVINWLGQNKLKESIPNFRLAGVDGNKLLNCTDTDLSGISCPEKEIRIIMNFIKQVDTPNRPFVNARYNKSDGYKRPPPPTHVDSGEDSDGEGWGSDEFDDTSVAKLYAVVKKAPKQQVTLRPPPRKKRPIVYRRSVVQPIVADDSEPEDYLEPEAPSRPPPVPPTQSRGLPSLQNRNQPKGQRRPPPPKPASPEQDQDDYMDPEAPQPQPTALRRPPPKPVSKQQSEELYDDPDKTVKVQNVHGGPLPPLPGSIPSNKPSSQQKAPSQRRQVPPPKSRVQEPESSDSEDAFYEEPDEGKLTVSKPPQAPANVPKRPGKLKQPTPIQQEEQEVYEEPDVPAPPISANKKGKKPSPPPEPDQEVYEDPDVDQPESGLAPPVPRNVPKRPFSMQPTQHEPEDYEEPDVTPPPPSRPGPPSNVPRRPVGKPAPPPQPNEQEVYEEPDTPPQAPSIPRPPRNIPKHLLGKKNPASEPVQQDVYEVPDVEAIDDGNGEDYLDMSEGGNLPPLSDRLVNDDGNGEDYLDMSEGGNLPPLSDRLADDDNSEDYLDMNEGGILSPISSRPTPPTQKRRNEKISKAQPKMQTLKPPPQPQMEEETYEEPDAPPPRPPVSQAKDPPKTLPPPPLRSKENYTQVRIKEDKGSPRPVATVSPTTTGNEVLDQQKWFYGDTNREVIRKRLEQQKVNGMYVIRNSTKSPTEPYTLQIFYDGKVYNLSIRRRGDNKYAIGAVKSDEKGFSTLLDLINFFKQNFLVLQGGSQTKLLRSLPKE